TPGGHRRFSEEDLRGLVAGRGAASGEPYTSLGQLALSPIRRRPHPGRGHAPWYPSTAEGAREPLPPLGPRLVPLVSEYMTKGARRSHLIDEAREIGHEYGRELVRDRLGLRDAVGAVTFFRKGLGDPAMELAQ